MSFKRAALTVNVSISDPTPGSPSTQAAAPTETLTKATFLDANPISNEIPIAWEIEVVEKAPKEEAGLKKSAG